jgi:diguanylate cyclase (GGDEF)-like protein/PAS domain S-box-containing protein
MGFEWSTRARLFRLSAWLGVAAVLVGTVVSLGFVVHDAQRDGVRAAERRFAERAQVSAALTQSVFGALGTSSQVELRRQFGGTASDVAPRLRSQLKQARLPYMAVLDRRAEVIAAVGRRPASFAVGEVLRGGPALSDVRPSPGGRVIEFGAKFVGADGARLLVEGVPLAVMRAFLGDYLMRLPNPDGAVLTMVDGNGAVLADGRPSRTVRSPKETITAASAVPGTHWRLRLVAERARVLAGVNRLPWLAWAMLGAVGLAILVAAVLVRRVLRASRSQRRANLALRESQEKMHGLVDALEEAVFLKHADGRLELLNAAAKRLLDTDADVMSDQRPGWTALTDDGEHLDLDRGPVAMALETRELQRAVVGIERPDGSRTWVEVSARPLTRPGEDRPYAAVVSCSDVTQRRELEIHLTDLANRDPLTGLWNRRRFEQDLSQQVARCKRYGEHAVLLVLDIDGFKQVNDTLGHLTGDDVLRVIAEALTERLRETDCAARLGGDEFAALLLNTSEEEARAVVADLELLVLEAVRAVQDEIVLSLSIGVAALDANTLDVSAALAAADRAMYARKHAAMHPPRSVVHRPTSGAVSFHPDGVTLVLEAIRAVTRADVAWLTRPGAQGLRVEATVDRGDTVGVVAGHILPGAGTPPQAGHVMSASADLHDRGRATLWVARRDPGRPFRPSDRELVEALAPVAEDEMRRERALRQGTETASLRALLAAVNARDSYTGGHSRQVVGLARAVAIRMGVDEAVVSEVEQVALLHDLGKIAVPDSILRKRGPLTDEEQALMRQHPVVGAQIVSSTPELEHLAPAIRAEHERWDGRGYPDGLAGEEIPLASRITFVCDAFHAMTSHRPYRRALSREEARAEVARCAGTQFCPSAVEAFLEVVEAGSDVAVVAA